MNQGEDSDLQEQIEQAWQQIGAGRWDDALRLFQSVLLLDPDSAMANHMSPFIRWNSMPLLLIFVRLAAPRWLTNVELSEPR